MKAIDYLSSIKSQVARDIDVPDDLFKAIDMQSEMDEFPNLKNVINQILFAHVAKMKEESDKVAAELYEKTKGVIMTHSKEGLDLMVSGDVDKKIRDVKNDIANYRTNIASYNEHIAKKSKDLFFAGIKLAKLEAEERITVKEYDFDKFFAPLLNNRFYKFTRKASAGSFWVYYFETQHVTLVKANKKAGINLSVPMGTYNLKVYIRRQNMQYDDKLRVSLSPGDDNITYDDYYHPHFDSDGGPCLGALHEKYHKALNSGDIGSVARYAQLLLCDYNKESPYAALELFAVEAGIIEDTDFVCRHCVCSAELHSHQTTTGDARYRNICQSCFDDEYYKCQHCPVWVHADDAVSGEDHDFCSDTCCNEYEGGNSDTGHRYECLTARRSQ